jgi:hypothetical protein
MKKPTMLVVLPFFIVIFIWLLTYPAVKLIFSYLIGDSLAMHLES